MMVLIAFLEAPSNHKTSQINTSSVVESHLKSHIPPAFFSTFAFCKKSFSRKLYSAGLSLFLFLMLIFIQLSRPLIHLYIYLLALAITLYFFISLQRLSCRLIRNRCSWAGGYLQRVCGRGEQFPGQKRAERGKRERKETLNARLPRTAGPANAPSQRADALAASLLWQERGERKERSIYHRWRGTCAELRRLSLVC